MAALKAYKKELRQAMRRALSEISADSIAKQTQNVVSLLVSMPEYQAAHRVGVYLSMVSGEIATASIVRHALQHGKQVFVPYTYRSMMSSPGQPASVMDMVSLHSWDDYENLRRDAWGIPTPSDESIPTRACCFRELWNRGRVEETPSQGLDLIVVPGMAFDTDRRRLGHGKGYYDFFLQRYQEHLVRKDAESSKMPFLVGLALAEQVLPEPQAVPTGSTDWPLDSLLVGDGRVLRAEGESRLPRSTTSD